MVSDSTSLATSLPALVPLAPPPWRSLSLPLTLSHPLSPFPLPRSPGRLGRPTALEPPLPEPPRAVALPLARPLAAGLGPRGPRGPAGPRSHSRTPLPPPGFIPTLQATTTTAAAATRAGRPASPAVVAVVAAAAAAGVPSVFVSIFSCCRSSLGLGTQHSQSAPPCRPDKARRREPKGAERNRRSSEQCGRAASPRARTIRGVSRSVA